MLGMLIFNIKNERIIKTKIMVTSGGEYKQKLDICCLHSFVKCSSCS